MEYQTFKKFKIEVESIAQAASSKNKETVEKAVEKFFEAAGDDILGDVEIDEEECQIHEVVYQHVESEMDFLQEEIEDRLLTVDGEETDISRWWVSFVGSPKNLGDLLDRVSDDLADRFIDGCAQSRNPMSYYGCRQSDFL